MSKFWQAPGNGKGFDSFLGDNSKMNNRTMGVLSYIKEKSSTEGFVVENIFQKEIKEYLLKYFHENPNESLETHFYKPALFYGFITRNQDRKLSLSIEGNLFLNNYHSKNYIACKKLIINQLDNTTYPNIATAKVKTLKLFPFRILFKLLLQNRTLNADFISTQLVHVSQLKDLLTYTQTQNLSSIQSFTMSSTKFKKFNTWVINSLVDLEILTLKEKMITIHPDVLIHIQSLYTALEFSDMFFEITSCEIEESIANKRVKRDATLIEKAKQRDKYICALNHEHTTFISKGHNYVEGHHVIPMFQQKNYAFKLDDVDNIRSLCPTCHREIHSADNKIDILKKLYTLQKDYMQINHININDLYRMYACA